MKTKYSYMCPKSIWFAAISTAPIVVLGVLVALISSLEVSLLAVLLTFGFVHFYLTHRWKESHYRALNLHHVRTGAVIQVSCLNLRYRLPLKPPSLEPEDLLELYGHLIVKRPGVIVECGSGVSTLVLAQGLKSLGSGKLVAIEQDKEWAHLVQHLVKENNLNEYCEVVWAPLVEQLFGDRIYSWYDHARFDMLFEDAQIDLLLVDGPIRTAGALARYPALPYFFDKMSSRGEILLDDVTSRSEERATVVRWLNEFPIQVVKKSPSGRIWTFERCCDTQRS